MGKRHLFNKWCLENWTATCKRRKLDHFLTLYKKIHSKYFKDLNVSPETIKILEEKQVVISDIGCSNFFLNMSPEARETKAKINYQDFIEIESFSAQQRKQSTKLKRQPTEQKMYANYISGHQTHKKMHNVTHHQGNTNQNLQ